MKKRKFYSTSSNILLNDLEFKLLKIQKAKQVLAANAPEELSTPYLRSKVYAAARLLSQDLEKKSGKTSQ